MFHVNITATEDLDSFMRASSMQGSCPCVSSSKLFYTFASIECRGKMQFANDHGHSWTAFKDKRTELRCGFEDREQSFGATLERKNKTFGRQLERQPGRGFHRCPST